MEALLDRQNELRDKFQQMKVNFGKDSASRKTSEYIIKRLEALDNFWSEFDKNNTQLTEYECLEQPYYRDNIYEQTKINYQAIRKLFSSYGTETEEKSTEPCGKVDELLAQQRTNFRAFMRLVKGIKVDEISEKWELDDELQNIQSRWATIDKLHLEIDNILQGTDTFYDEQFSGYEKSYKTIKRELNTKLCSTAHKQQATPQLEIPIFTGKYTHWPTFYDLFCEAVHNNKSIQKGQKMQHLKGKLRGEAERLVQHLYISAENYDVAWDILTRRYNNPQVLFTKHIEIFLNQPIIHKQTASDIRRLHDTSMECINSIHNLGVDTNTWDPLLVHLLSKKLDPETYSDFRESRKAPRELPALDEFMSFLENKFTALEPITQKREKEPFASTLSPKKFTSYQKFTLNNKPNYNGKIPYKSYQAVPAYTCKCPLCNLEHDLYKCRKFINLTPDNKLKAVLQNKVCQNCLYKHYDNACLSTKRCKECNGEHNTLLHDSYYQPTLSSSTMHSATPSTSKQLSKSPNVGHVASEDEEVLLTTISLKVQSSSGEYIILRALLDQGSQISLISEKAAQLLGLPRQCYHASIAGIGTGSNQSKGVVTLNCESIYEDYQFSTKALVISRVINNLPNVSFIKNKMPHISNIKLADPEYNVSRPIDLLLDASIYSTIIMNGLIRSPGQNIIAQQTKLGWILSGNVKTFNCHVVINDLAAISKYWELEDITSSSSSMTEQEQYCEDFYQKTTRRLENGAYEVGLPMKRDFEQQLGISKPKAIAQFKQIENKLERNEQLCHKYKQFISEYQHLGHMRESYITTEPSCYLPHHGVMKLDSTTTTLRVVFNASSKNSTGHSLNDLMECGPNLQQDLQSLILNWRQYKYVITADIEKMFRTIFIRESDQHLQKIIWRDSPLDPLKDYQLTTVTYGMKAAPYLAMRTLRQLAIDDGHKYPLAGPAIGCSFYMDDLLTGSNSINHAKELQQQLITMLKGAGMNLRKWSSNEPQIITELSQDQIDTPLDFRCAESRKTLGLRWNASSDDFTFQTAADYQDNIKHHTKRQLLSDISKIFDPLGWLSPITVRAKLLFQRAWASGITWDDQLPESIQNDWNMLRTDMMNINQFTITRHLGNTEKECILHGFCDASQKIYSAAVYIITADDKGEYISKLVIAKTKLAPLSKNTSLPRLELCGAVLLAQLMQKVRESISCISEETKMYAWTDSMVVLGWIKGDISRWKQFVANRVQQVTDIIEASNWYHVRSENNAADCATRGLSSSQLKEHTLWWEGPKWLLNFNPNDITPPPCEPPTIEITKHKVHTALCSNNNLITDLLERHGSISRVVRIAAWISRFITKARKQNIEHATFLTSAELNNAYHIIIKEVQRNEFEEDLINIKKKGHVSKLSKIVTLNPFIDNNGLLRVGGRLSNSSIPEPTKHPIILSSHGRLTELIIDQWHMTTLHGNADPISLHPSSQWQLVQALNNQLWKRWSTEYLQQLQARTKWRTPCRNMQLGDVVLIKEDNLPPGKWALARVQELHPGKDGYVRVVTLKTQSNIIKRPVSKLALLPVNEYQSDDQSKASMPNKQEPLSQTVNQPTQNTNTWNRRRGITFKSLFTTLLLFISLISSSTQSNITALHENQAIYFDKICNLQHVRDQWKLIVYYNMSTYWEGLSDVTKYVAYLNEFSLKANCDYQQYKSITTQLEHELNEIQHFNTLLRYQNSRQKRGLVDGIGYIANQLFGVLDERFAEQYEKDILHITQNENHLRNLLKNQTSIIEAEYNILRRHENIITKQFTYIKEHLTNITSKINEVENTIRKEFYIISSSLAAYATLTNIRRIQQTLVDTITDLSQGRIDPHLLSPEQLHQQINIISGHLHGELTLPIDKDNIKDIYKLSRIAARVYNDYLIMEIKIPIVSSDIFELDKVISIPQKKRQQMYEVIPVHPYLAFNLQKDLVLFLSENDISSCTSVSEDKLICSLNQPTYNLNIKQSLCDINVKAADQNTQQSFCKSVISTCDNRWIKLRRLNAWLYSCCEVCKVRIFCPAGTEIQELHDNGIIDIGQGCTLKSETLTIYGHNNFINQITIESDIKVPEVSILNNIINSTMQVNFTELESDHHGLYHQLRAQIDELKEQSETQITIHDVHHYTVSYVIITIALTISIIIIYLKRCRRPQEKQEPAVPSSSESESEVVVKKGNRVLKIEQGTSPVNPRIVRFEPIPNE